MILNKKLKKILDITSYPPSWCALIYLANVSVFSLIYALFFENDFKDHPINFFQSLYFSVVTVTTLGFGDLTPKLEVTSLLVTIITQVVVGVFTIGLFLNAISHKLSDRKDSAKKEHEKEMEEKSLATLLAIVKPTFVSYLQVLSETYKVTTTREEKDFIYLAPSEVFTVDYFDQISRQNFLSEETRYGRGTMKWGQFICQENGKFTSGIDDFINKFSNLLPIDIVGQLVYLKNHRFLNHSTEAIQMDKIRSSLGMNVPALNILSIEHSSVNIPDKPDSISDFHHALLNIISLIDEKVKGDKMAMIIDLRKGVSFPSIGSAIGDVIRFDYS